MSAQSFFQSGESPDGAGISHSGLEGFFLTYEHDETAITGDAERDPRNRHGPAGSRLIFHQRISGKIHDIGSGRTGEPTDFAPQG